MRIRSLATRFNLLICAILIVIFGALLLIVAYQSYQSNLRDSEKVAELTGEKLSAQILSMYQQSIVSVQSVKAELQKQRAEGAYDRKGIIKLLQQVLVANPYAVGMSVCFEPNAFDSEDKRFVRTSGHDGTGRFVPYAFKGADGTMQVKPMVDYDKEESAWYFQPKNTQKGYIAEPSISDINGTRHLVSRICLPLLDENGSFLGVAAIDIELTSLQSMLDGMDQTATLSYLVTDKGTIVAYEDSPDFVLKNIMELRSTLTDDISRLAKGEPFSRIVREQGTGETLRVFVPLVFTEVQTDWSFVSEVPMGELMANFNHSLLILVLVILGGLLIIALAIVLFMHISVSNPIQRILAGIKRVAEGDLDSELALASKTELGSVAEHINRVCRVLRELVQQTRSLTDEAVKGRYDARAACESFGGGYRSILEGVNGTLDAVVDKVYWYESLLDSISNPITVTDMDMNWTFANKGMLDLLGAKREKMIGKKCANWNANICKNENCGIVRLRKGLSETMFEHLGRNFRITTSYLTDRRGEKVGHIELISDVTKDQHKGRYRNTEVDRLAKNLDKLAQGNLALELDVEAADEYTAEDFEHFSRINASLRQARESMAGYIEEIAHVLGQVEKGDLDVEAAGDFRGDFAPIKESMNRIIDSLNEMLRQIKQSSAQVLGGAGQVASAAQALSRGSSEQASSVDELSASIEDISKQIRQNAQGAREVRDIALDSAKTLDAGKGQMADLMAAMGKIDESAKQIGKIIRTIDEIAFQTNILALNAAVEAARAGEAGKGFAVVADEVRNLATKSAEAAKNTTALIKNSLLAVEQGTKLAGATAQTLGYVVEEGHRTGELIAQISHNSSEQAQAIALTTQGVARILQVVQANSSTAEQSAAASEELSSQADMLNQLVGKFNLRKKLTKK